eukprot:3463292-Rhodomonas_salina.6
MTEDPAGMTPPSGVSTSSAVRRIEPSVRAVLAVLLHISRESFLDVWMLRQRAQNPSNSVSRGVVSSNQVHQQVRTTFEIARIAFVPAQKPDDRVLVVLKLAACPIEGSSTETWERV